MADEPRGSFELEPAPIRPRRRRFDPLVLGVAVVVGGLALAIVKPWDDAAPGASAPVPSASPVAFTASAPTTPGAPRSGLPPAERVTDVLRKRDAWGVRAIVSNQDGEADRWVATPIGTGRSEPYRIGGGTERIVALGVTSPAQVTPLDVRIWRPTTDWGWQWLDVRPVATDVPGADLLFWPPATNGDAPGTWPAGRYRIDVLRGSTIERIDIELPGRFRTRARSTSGGSASGRAVAHETSRPRGHVGRALRPRRRCRDGSRIRGRGRRHRGRRVAADARCGWGSLVVAPAG